MGQLTTTESGKKCSNNSNKNPSKKSFNSFKKSGQYHTIIKPVTTKLPPDTNCQALLKQVLGEYPDQQFVQTLKQLIERLPLYKKKCKLKPCPHK